MVGRDYKHIVGGVELLDVADYESATYGSHCVLTRTMLSYSIYAR